MGFAMTARQPIMCPPYAQISRMKKTGAVERSLRTRLARRSCLHHASPSRPCVSSEIFRRDGKLLVWRDVKAGGHGLADSFNLDQGRASFDTLGIDAGPMLLAIENVRTGLIWRLFHEHEAARRAVRLLQWSKRSEHE